MKKEIEQINNIKISLKIKYAFISTSGYDDCDYECIDINSLYNI